VARESFLIVNGDTLTDVNIVALVDDHRSSARW
jgi:NDP-sugar pyrophosphorylase family protein